MLEALTILAILLSPFLAVFAQSKINERSESQQRKLQVYKTLMGTRAESLSRAHVEALNRIDVEFTDNSKGEMAVREAWKELLDLFETWPQPPTRSADMDDDAFQAALLSHRDTTTATLERHRDKLAELLSEMGKCLGYKFDKVHIRRAAYRPSAYADLEAKQMELLSSTTDILSGRRAFPMWVANWPTPSEDQKRLTDLLENSIDDGAYKVVIVDRPKDENTGKEPEN